MGSSKKSRKAATPAQSSECLAIGDVELKVFESDCGDGQLLSGVGAPAELETPATTEPVNSSEISIPPEVPLKAEHTEPPASNSGEVSAEAQKSLDAKDSSASVALFNHEKSIASSSSLPPSGIPLSLKPEMSTEWPFTRKRQVFNVVYFGLISFQLLTLTRAGVAPWAAYFCLALVGFLTAASLFYLFNHRKHQTSHDEFSPRVRRSLRAVGLLVPAFLMFAIARTDSPIPDAKNVLEENGIPSSVLSPIAGNFAGEMAWGKRDFKRHRFESALNHFENAANIDPSSDVALAWIAESNDSMMRLTPALSAAMRAMDINPNNEQAHVVAAHYYNIAQQFDKARDYAERAISLNPEDGEAYGYASTAYKGLGNIEQALTYANGHVKWHYYEAKAFEQRAQILEQLGRHSEAEYTRELARKVREVGVR